MDSISVRLHRDREEISRFCEHYDNIYVFGTGFIANQIIVYLDEEQVRIKGILVSNGHKDNDRVNGIDVIEISEADIRSTDGIILGVNSAIQKEVESVLLSRGVDEKQIYHQMIYSVSNCPVVMNDGIMNREIRELDGGGTHNFFSVFSGLNELGNKYHTDKSSELHNYLNKYEFFLQRWKDKQFNLLELGVLNGSSLHMWEDYFANAEIYGVDINPECAKEEGGRRHVHIMDLTLVESYKKLGMLSPSIIVDDGSHMWSHQLKSLFYLFRELPAGGVFIMEDLETSFSAYRGFYYMDAAVSTYTVLETIAKVVCSNEVLRKEKVSAVIWDLKSEIEEISRHVDCISFIQGSCIIIKK